MCMVFSPIFLVSYYFSFLSVKFIVLFFCPRNFVSVWYCKNLVSSFEDAFCFRFFLYAFFQFYIFFTSAFFVTKKDALKFV